MNAITRNNSTLISQNLKTTSLIVAEKFGKRHDNVLRDIDNLDLPKDYCLLNFEERVREVSHGQGEDRKYKYYEMIRDGFSLLVMGFTGKKAMEWKIRFLEAFNAMEKQLTSPAAAALPPIPKLTPAQRVEIQKQMFLRFPDGPRRAQAYIALKEHFGVARYYEIKGSRFDEAIAFLEKLTLRKPVSKHVYELRQMITALGNDLLDIDYFRQRASKNKTRIEEYLASMSGRLS